ncbi:hypothetical protein GOBAR_AA22574 [Gossypium barbadense]|uniref:Uncharacterized protein n=1 Tax=Gossypium barbadense TaxID=3634 RepID=A0A2P5X413_GOSBA|nr:hypothetical protein GOBAR_AA22574 [Gossypium barbadense]
MFRARSICARLSTHFKTRPFCSSIKDGKNKKKNNIDIVDGKIESNVSTVNESYRQLDNLDFLTAAKILFTHPPKKKKFGLDFHLVQLFFACMPSLAVSLVASGTAPQIAESGQRRWHVSLVAQYARYEMRKMEAQNASEPGEDKSKSESSSSAVVQDKAIKQKSIEQIPNADPSNARSVSPDSDASRKDQKGENQIGGPSQDAKR